MPLTHEQRQKIVAIATSFIGTPYKGHSMRKGAKGGVDCGTMLAAIYMEAGLLTRSQLKIPAYYSLSVAQHKESTEYIDLIATYFDEIPEATVLPGDIVVFKMDFAYAHAAIVTEWPAAIHALAVGGVRGCNSLKHPRLFKTQRKFFTLKECYIPAESDDNSAIGSSKSDDLKDDGATAPPVLGEM